MGAYDHHRSTGLLSETESLDQTSVFIVVFSLEVLQESLSPTYHLEQAPARVVIFLVGFEMIGQVVDSFSQNCDLNLGRASIIRVGPIALDYGLLVCFIDQNEIYS
jgi:hypothetical protein